MNVHAVSQPPPRAAGRPVWTVETSAAIIKFTGGAGEDFSGSESESEAERPASSSRGSPTTANHSASAPIHSEAAVQNGVEGQGSSPTEDQEINVLPHPSPNPDCDPSLMVSQDPGNDLESPTDLPTVPTTIKDVTKIHRFNPFDRDMHMEENHYDASSATDPGTTDSYIIIDDSEVDSLSEDSFLSDPEPVETPVTTKEALGVAEDHFSRPEGTFAMSTVEELESGITHCKEQILQAPDPSDQRKNLIHKLIQLRIKLIETKEGPVEEDDDVKTVVGHRFKQRESSGSKHYCETCGSVIWGVVQTWYKCTACGFCCHDKCLNLIYRTCANVKVKENSNYILSICPEKGLDSQNYRCAECSTPLSFRAGHEEARRCDYTGAYYCRRCHWNDVMIVPARVVHNWDLEPRKVCRASKQFLRLMAERACLRIQDINPMLFSLVEELNDVKKLREEILIMKRYFLSCQDALSSKLLLQLTCRQHFVDNSDIYSLQDLMDVASDILLPELAKIHSSFAQHIKTDCHLCQAKGYICELCDMQEVLFPFDNIAIVCDRCSTVLHRHCLLRKNRTCPKCERMDRRAAMTSQLSEDVCET